MKIYDESENWKEWVAVKDFRTCVTCKRLGGKIYGINEIVFPEPQLHPNCRCKIETMRAILGKDANYYINIIITSGRDIYDDIDGKLPDAPERIWYEADTSNIDGNKGAERILYSSDGLVFVTEDDYKTFVEVEGNDFLMKWLGERANNLRPQSLMDELTNSGVKYNIDDVVMITKTPDGKLLWLEKGNSTSGLNHILDRHGADFTAKGINDIPSFLNKILQEIPTETGINNGRPYSEYIINGNTYRVAYGTNGYIVSFFPVG